MGIFCLNIPEFSEKITKVRKEKLKNISPHCDSDFSLVDFFFKYYFYYLDRF
jgi:hypothetical protein